MKQKKIVMYATANKGEGFVQKIGEFDNIRDIEIRIEMFDKDVVITLWEEFVEEEEEGKPNLD